MDPDTLEAIEINNEDVWEWNWTDYNDTIQTVDCEDLIDSWTDMKLSERLALKAELPSTHFLCPNTTSFNVLGGSLGDIHLELEVYALQSTKDLGVNAIFVIEISRAFDPESY